MRSSLFILGAATTYVAAQSCNSSFNVTSTGECIQKCSIDAGKSIDPNYNLNPSSPNFIKSVGLFCNKQNSDYIAFMTKAGTCWTGCDKASQDAYTKVEFPATCQWYQAHKDDKCESTGTNNNSTSTEKSPSSSNKLQTTGIVGLLALGVSALLY
ncbi:hypothetical protein BJ944DRAFT_271450 [Cunninghamella echinulata]|nr:hypothetical protein BJ944DRAFT_271450 [Cunninghamella echinulata]